MVIMMMRNDKDTTVATRARADAAGRSAPFAPPCFDASSAGADDARQDAETLSPLTGLAVSAVSCCRAGTAVPFFLRVASAITFSLGNMTRLHTENTLNAGTSGVTVYIHIYADTEIVKTQPKKKSRKRVIRAKRVIQHCIGAVLLRDRTSRRNLESAARLWRA
jgi:hypothetical protein